MTNDEILQAAKEAGYGTAFYSDNNKLFHEEIWGGPMETQKVRSLIKIIEKRTIERCAVVAEELRHPYGFSGENVDWCAGTDHAAAAIRAME